MITKAPELKHQSSKDWIILDWRVLKFLPQKISWLKETQTSCLLNSFVWSWSNHSQTPIKAYLCSAGWFSSIFVELFQLLVVQVSNQMSWICSLRVHLEPSRKGWRSRFFPFRSHWQSRKTWTLWLVQVLIELYDFSKEAVHWPKFWVDCRSM